MEVFNVEEIIYKSRVQFQMMMNNYEKQIQQGLFEFFKNNPLILVLALIIVSLIFVFITSFLLASKSKKDCVKRLMFLFILKKFLFISFTIVVVIFIYKKVQYSQSYIYDAIEITMMNNII